MERENTRKPASKAFVLSLFAITIILILLLFFIFCKMMPRGGFDIDSISVRQDSGEIQYQYSGGDWKKIISPCMSCRGKDGVVLKSKRLFIHPVGDIPGNLNGKIS